MNKKINQTKEMQKKQKNNPRQWKSLRSTLESRFMSRFINHAKSANIDMFNRLEF